MEIIKNIFGGKLMLGRISSIGLDLELHLRNNWSLIENFIEENALEGHEQSVDIAVKIRMRRFEDGQWNYTEFYRHTGYISTNEDALVEIAVKRLVTALEDFIENGSGWELACISFIDVTLNNFNILMRRQVIGHGDVIDLPKALKNKQAVYNLENTNGKCFLYSLLCVLKHASVKAKHDARSYNQFLDIFDVSGIDFPFNLGSFNRFHVLNKKYAINIFEYLKDEVKILRRPSLRQYDGRTVINILFITIKGKGHFLPIINFNRLMNSRMRDGKRTRQRFYCHKCRFSFITNTNLQLYINKCYFTNEKVLKPPKDPKFFLKNYSKTMEPSHILFADFKCIITDEGEHLPIAAGYIRWSNYENYTYESYCGLDCVSWFVKQIKAEMTYVKMCHVGISGNEKADFAARSALSLPVEPQVISYKDFYMYIFKHILSIWQSKWDGEINNKLHAIKPKLGEWALACRKSRKEETRSQSDIESLNSTYKKPNKNDVQYDAAPMNTTKATTPWPRFLVIKQTNEDQNKSLNKLSPFAINKTIISLGGEPKSVKKLFSGDILVETLCKSHSDKLLKSKLFFDIPVTVSPHGSLNYSKGVIRSRELKDCSEDELLQELGEQGITAVKKISITRNNNKITTGTIILTFDTPEPPTCIKAAYLNIRVEKYIPNPLRCFKCQKFGHHQTTCKSDIVCGRCGEVNHIDTGCKNTPRCVNCSGSHPSYSRECPNYILERKIITHKVNNKTSFPEARRIVLASNSPTSYAKVVASNAKKEASTQTDLTWPIKNTHHNTSKIDSTCQTESKEVAITENTLNTNSKQNVIKKSNLNKQQNKSKKEMEPSIPTPCKNTITKNKTTKTYERVLKPLTPAQLKTSTESIDFPPMDAIRSAAEAQETSDNDMDFVTVTASKYDEICRLLNDHNPTAMCLQETHLNDTFNTTIRRYSIYRRDLPSEHPAGGVCIIVNNQIPHSSVQLNSSLQAIAVRVSMHKVLTICSIYIPPSSPIIAADVEDLLRQLPAPALICGDFNGHNLLWGSRVTNPRGRTIENIILHNNLCLFNDTSMTYLDLSAGTYSALDLTLCHPSLFQDFTWMVDGDLHTSDHFPIHVKGNGPPIKGRPQRWKLHKADWTMFKQLCAEQLNISSFAEISNQYSEFITILLEVAEISIPKTSQYPKRFNKPWFNKDCKDAVRERKRLLRKFSLRPTSDNLSSYRQAAAAARRTIRQAKRESWRQYVSKLNSQSTIKSAWDRLRKIRGKGTSDAYKHLNVGGTAITSQFGIANALGQSFCRNSSSDNCTGSFRSYKNRAESHQLDFKTTNTEVYNQVFSLEELRRSLRASKDTSPGPDSIHYQMLKHLPDCSLALMLNIFNTIWITGAIPSSWLEATVIPIPKPGKDHTDPSNYRPIALTSCICKTMERMINCRLTYFLETNNIFTKYQSGFRRHRSTIDHLVKFETLVREAFVRREHLVAVFFDLEKAYETTWKYGILRDLFNSGLRGRMPIFINHFLTNRKFRVRVGTTFSDRFDLEMGVPQGSILSVTLFSLKINDIVNHVKSGTQCFLYVDDLVVAYASKSISTIERHLQLSLNKIEKWTNENGFKFSSSKTVSMHYCLLTRPHHDPQLRLGSSPIPLVNSTRFLGLIFDKKLNFLKHMQVLKSKCLRALNLLRILSNTNWGADRKVMLRFYRSLIRSKLDYGSVVYGSARKSYLRVLDPVHNQGLRLSLGAFRTTPAESLYVEAHEPSLYLRREKLSLQYACRLRANPENPCYDVTFHPNHRETFARRQNSIPTFGLRVLPLFEQIGLPLGNIAKCVLPSIPPWTMNRPIINFSLTGLKKGTTPSYVYLNKFLEVSDSYHGYHHIYTDGSRQNDEVAAAAISSLRSLSSRLPDKSSIFSAESKALLLALDIVENSTYGRYIILSDSLSCLMALDNMKYSHPTICEILFKLHNLSFSNHVIFCWLPSHVGISGNEKADFAAKSALSLPVDHQFISYHDFYMYILKHILSIWQSKWDGEINNKLHAIKPKLGEWALAYRKSRKEESILCRLRVGHTYLTHSFLLRNEAQPVCGRCQLPLTVRHVLVDCAALTSVRSRFYSPPPWEEFFQEDCSETELLQELESQGITSVKKISITKNGKRITTGTIILTFNSPEPPKAIKAAYLNVSVDRSKYDEICRLLNDHNPTAMCLQETRLNDTYNTTIRRYSIYRRDLPSEHPAGGVCIIVNNQIPHSSVQLNSSLQAIAVRVSMHKVLTICSIYIPPSSPIIAADVEDLLRQLPAPALICGDFNGHNLLWGSRVTNPRGRTIENIILHNNLCLFNDTSMTYLDLSAGTYSALDLTLCHPSLLQDFTWMVDGDLHTSDHFPIHVKGNGPPIKGRPQRWKLHKADWTMFKQLCAEQLNISSFAEISDQYSEFITILLEVAEISIPKTSQYPKRFNKPWFNKDCKDAVRERKRLLRKFSLRPTSDNLSSYRQAAAAARRTIRQAKRESWRQYVSKLNSQSSIKSAWDRLRKIRGKGTSDAYKHLNVGGTAITSQFGIANALGQSFYSLSCLMALDNMKYSHPTICDILVKLHFLTESNHVIFCWLPSHVGISGNEKADFAAKSALSLPSKWDGEINNKLHAIKPKLGEWALAYRKSLIKQTKDEKNKSLSKLSPFAINKTIICIGGEPKSVKKLFSGDILVETQNKSHTEKLLNAKTFFDIPVTVSPHSSLNYSKGVIRSRELMDCSEDELLEELSYQGIIAVKKIIITRNGKKIATSTIILTFNTSEPPKSIKAAYLNVSVDRYIPNPLRCFNCQKFGHHQTTCKHDAVCGRCGEDNHNDSGCDKTPCCVNCKGKHPSYSRECPDFILEKQVVSYKYNNNTTFPEARRLVLSLHSSKSYAKVTATNTKKRHPPKLNMLGLPPRKRVAVHKPILANMNATEKELGDDDNVIECHDHEQLSKGNVSVLQNSQDAVSTENHLSGDFHQLSPIANQSYSDDGSYCVQSAFLRNSFHHVQLTVIHRQAEPDFIAAIHQIARITEDTHKLLKRLKRNLPPGPQPVKLFALNLDVEMWNSECLLDMEGKLNHLYKTHFVYKQ
ncbi:RNA-directed DNA polymerase from mobile element jockey [Nymphon striatum]|nr:RNA-directed DNA polymerase from mobile element jockey [Nymphon striatum]